MEREVSVIAHKLETYFDHSAEEAVREEAKTKEPGIFNTLACISLMAIAVFLTKISLILTRTVKRLEK